MDGDVNVITALSKKYTDMLRNFALQIEILQEEVELLKKEIHRLKFPLS